MKTFFGVNSKKSLNLFFCKCWAPFFEVKNVGRQFCAEFQGFAQIFRGFARMFDKSKLLGVCLNPLHPRLLHRW